METFGLVLGWILVALTICVIATTLLKIHRDVGLLSPAGLPWAAVVIVGSLFGVVLYRWFRYPIERATQRLLRRGN